MAKKVAPAASSGTTDRRAIERVGAYVEQQVRGKDFKSLEELNKFVGELTAGKKLQDMELSVATAPEAAQAKIFDAYDTHSSSKRVALAKEALKLYPDCADAYVILAEEEEDWQKALTHYRYGVEAGSRALGAAQIEENKGNLWYGNGRSYLRALYGVANCHYELDEYEEAAAVAKEMLVLNTRDNQGVRYLLIPSLIMLKKFTEAKKVLDKFKEEDSAHILYSKALVLFNSGKNLKAADEAMRKAFFSNAFIAPLLLSPSIDYLDEVVTSYSPGSMEEAILYCQTNHQCWYAEVETFQWLQHSCSMYMLAMAAGMRQQDEEERRLRFEGRIKQKSQEKVLDLNFFLNNKK